MDQALDILKTYQTLAISKHDELIGGVSKNTLIVIGIACFLKVLLIDIIFGRSGQLICHFIGFVYPAYRTTKVIESKHNEDGEEEDKVQWLMYWVVFSTFHLVEFFSDTILGWIPTYWVCKSLFLIGCMTPLNLSSFIYHKIILPVFKKNESMIDDVVSDCRRCIMGQCKETLSIDITTCGIQELAALSDSVLPPSSPLRCEKHNSPRPSPKKKRAPLPPKTINMEDDDKIEEYLNDHF